MESEHILVLCTVPDAAKGAEIAGPLVQEKLVACVNLIDKLRSLYWWDGEVCDDPEALMIIKTRADRFERVRERIVALHPYDTPEVIAFPITAGHPPYLKWIDETVKPG